MENNELLKKITYENKNVYDSCTPEDKKQMFDFCEGYKSFLNDSKTERECVQTALDKAKKVGFVSMDSKETLAPGDRVYKVNRDKNILLMVVGSESIKEGFHLVGSHIDSPRLDLKPNPLFESEEIAMLRTHYYGGIKKYQWTTIPLSMHGVVYLKNGEKVTLHIGEKEEDPIFCVTDLLPHLADAQVKKPAHKVIDGEKLTVFIGSIPLQDEEVKEKVKGNILTYLYENYQMEEADFLSAEIEIVPAGKARDAGLDRSVVASYGQDDRVCAYGALEAILHTENPQKTAVCILVDKEETGSAGNTGFRSRFFELCITQAIFKLTGQCDIMTLNEIYSRSKCLSGDVSAAVDPNYTEVYERGNSAFLNHGVAVNKYTGARGKGGTSDANAEFLYEIRRLFDENNVAWQICELGKVDEGGGGTIAQYVANQNIDTLDCGTAVLCMHAPMELASKADIYMTHKAYFSFFQMK